MSMRQLNWSAARFSLAWAAGSASNLVLHGGRRGKDGVLNQLRCFGRRLEEERRAAPPWIDV